MRNTKHLFLLRGSNVIKNNLKFKGMKKLVLISMASLMLCGLTISSVLAQDPPATNGKQVKTEKQDTKDAKDTKGTKEKTKANKGTHQHKGSHKGAHKGTKKTT